MNVLLMIPYCDTGTSPIPKVSSLSRRSLPSLSSLVVAVVSVAVTVPIPRVFETLLNHRSIMQKPNGFGVEGNGR